MGIETGVDVFSIMDVSGDIMVPIMDHIIRVDHDSLTLGYAGVYSSFLLFAKRAEAKYGIPTRDILIELGHCGMVGGQEDMIEDQRRTVIDKVTQALHEAVGAPKETIRILIQDVPKAHWGIGGTSAKDLGR